jgi:hypothetical protein
MWMIPWLPPHGDPTKSTYVLLADKFLGEITTAREEISAFKALWNCLAPSKVLCFSWKVLHNRVATRDNLFRRGIIHQEGDRMCMLCDSGVESIVHLFVYCDVSLWGRVFSWLGVEWLLPHNGVFAEFRRVCPR